jgi:hypothetical protein
LTRIFLFDAGVAQLVERQLPKLNVGSSNLLARFLPPLDPNSPQLTEEHLRQLAVARVLGRKITRAVSVARFDGWTLGIFGGLTLLIGYNDLSSILIGGALCVISFVELHAADKLRRLDITAFKTLMTNQAVLATLLIVYALWSLHIEASGGDMEAIKGQDPEVAQMLVSSQGLVQSLAAIIYGAIILVAVGGCGGMILFYLSRRRKLREYLETTPKWIIDMQAAGVSL